MQNINFCFICLYSCPYYSVQLLGPWSHSIAFFSRARSLFIISKPSMIALKYLVCCCVLDVSFFHLFQFIIFKLWNFYVMSSRTNKWNDINPRGVKYSEKFVGDFVLFLFFFVFSVMSDFVLMGFLFFWLFSFWFFRDFSWNFVRDFFKYFTPCLSLRNWHAIFFIRTSSGFCLERSLPKFLSD